MNAGCSQDYKTTCIVTHCNSTAEMYSYTSAKLVLNLLNFAPIRKELSFSLSIIQGINIKDTISMGSWPLQKMLHNNTAFLSSVSVGECCNRTEQWMAVLHSCSFHYIRAPSPSSLACTELYHTIQANSTLICCTLTKHV